MAVLARMLDQSGERRVPRELAAITGAHYTFLCGLAGRAVNARL